MSKLKYAKIVFNRFIKGGGGRREVEGGDIFNKLFYELFGLAIALKKN